MRSGEGDGKTLMKETESYFQLDVPFLLAGHHQKMKNRRIFKVVNEAWADSILLEYGILWTRGMNALSLNRRGGWI